MISKWKDEYSVDDETFDAHHKHLFDLILKSEELLVKSSNQKQLEDIINELKDYTSYHFSEEERRMSNSHFDALEKHKEAHQKFVKEIEAFEKRILDNEPFVLDDLVLFLSQWLINHIQTEDMKYKKLI